MELLWISTLLRSEKFNFKISLCLPNLNFIFQPKPYRWMLDVIWLNLVEMSKIDEFSILLEKVIDSEKDWKTWCDTEAPEEVSGETGDI